MSAHTPRACPEGCCDECAPECAFGFFDEAGDFIDRRTGLPWNDDDAEELAKTYEGPAPIGARFYVVAVDGDVRDTYAAPTLTEALRLASPDPGASVEGRVVTVRDAGAARLLWGHGVPVLKGRIKA